MSQVPTLARWLAPMLLVTGCAAPAPAPMPPSAPSPLAGKPLPDVKRPTLDGTRLDTGSLRGRVVVLKFFAEYCEPCKRTLPAAEGLHRQLPDVAFVGISEDDRVSTANELVARYQLTFPIVHDRGQALAGRFRVGELPATFVADATGTVRWVGGPAQTEDDLRRAIEASAR